MSKEIPIIRMQYGGDDAFPQTHVHGVIGIEELIEEYTNNDLILKANNGLLFKLVVDEYGELSTERIEGDNA
ncbi:hypothetical protein [Staphylococcus carnosus]|uniref:hypothetical protein n=1 Tax=Staphylococcus carnosus TaxID=1281 RepID=UPI0020A5BD5A|nr:hypothetical protein [Staphylococcus carnosus]UTB80986.1 hypothetical protein A2I65_08830 [Staphylococcus carnosus]